jgi:cation transport ATPase
LGDELRRLPWLIDLARKSYRIIAQNLFWAFGYNAVALTLAFFGRLHPLLAAVLMLFSSLFVLGNSLRLVRDP